MHISKLTGMIFSTNNDTLSYHSACISYTNTETWSLQRRPLPPRVSRDWIWLASKCTEADKWADTNFLYTAHKMNKHF